MCKIFHFACPNINMSIYNKIKIAPFTKDIFKFKYSAAGGSKGHQPGPMMVHSELSSVSSKSKIMLWTVGQG